MGSSPGWTVKTLGSSGSGSQAMWTQRPGINSRVSPAVRTPGADSTLTPSASENIGPSSPGVPVTTGSVGGTDVVDSSVVSVVATVSVVAAAVASGSVSATVLVVAGTD